MRKERERREKSVEPDPALWSLNIFVGTWNLSRRDPSMDGRIEERQVYTRWIEGGFFLVQEEFVVDDLVGITIIGYDSSRHMCTSHYYDNLGNTSIYGYELRGDHLRIVGLDSANRRAQFNGRISEDGNTVTGTWEWPGGGRQETMTRVS